jgi:hypothetical protein
VNFAFLRKRKTISRPSLMLSRTFEFHRFAHFIDASVTAVCAILFCAKILRGWDFDFGRKYHRFFDIQVNDHGDEIGGGR